jgi:hypothetical protein
VLPGEPNIFFCALRYSHSYEYHSHGILAPAVRDLRYSEARLDCTPSVWISPESNASMVALHILSGTPGGLQWLRYIVLMRRPTNNTPPHLSQQTQWIHRIEWFCSNEGWDWSRSYDSTQSPRFTQLRLCMKSGAEGLIPKVDIDWVCIFIAWWYQMEKG